MAYKLVKGLKSGCNHIGRGGCRSTQSHSVCKTSATVLERLGDGDSNLMLVCVCCSVCAGGDDDLLLLATEVGVVQTSVSGDSAQVVAPMASEGSNGEDTVNYSNPLNLWLFTCCFCMHIAHFTYATCELECDCITHTHF